MDILGKFTTAILAIIFIIFMFYAVVMCISPLMVELVEEDTFKNQGTYRYNDMIYSIKIDSVKTDSLYKTKNPLK